MHICKFLTSRGFLASAISAGLLVGAAARAEDSGRNFEIYGFAEADYIQDITGRLDPDWDDAFRPSKICFGASAASVRPAT